VALPEVRRLQELADTLHNQGAALRQYFAEPADSSLTGMFQCLAALWEALPCASNIHKVPPSPDLCELQRCLPSKECLVTSQQRQQQQQQQQQPNQQGSRGITAASLSPLRGTARVPAPTSTSPTSAVPAAADASIVVVADILQTPPRRPARAVTSPPPLPFCEDTLQDNKTTPAVIFGSATTKLRPQNSPHHRTNSAHLAPVALQPASAAGILIGGKSHESRTLEGAKFGLQVDADLRI